MKHFKHFLVVLILFWLFFLWNILLIEYMSKVNRCEHTAERHAAYLSTQKEKPIEHSSPSERYESIRRRLFHDIKDVAFFISSWLKAILKENDYDMRNKKINSVRDSFQDRINVLMAGMYNLSVSDINGAWRKKQALDLTSVIQKRIHQIQNPASCTDAKTIVCDLNKACGLGCQMHHVMYCFATAFFLNRTLIVQSQNWQYNKLGLEAYFKPFSENCTAVTGNPVAWQAANLESDLSVVMPIIDGIQNRPKFLPLAIPKEYERQLKSFHGDPFVFFGGLLLNYLMRFNTKFEGKVLAIEQTLNFNKQCVGVHVRRTDKIGSEAAFHGLDEYMIHVEQYFDVLELRTGKQVKRSVFLASDELDVLLKAKKEYPDYAFMFIESNARLAAMSSRYSPESAQGVILDIHFLSQCDYLVCTFSSQVCRMAYELMQARFPDASWRFKSLDDVYYFGGQNGHTMVAIYDHEPSGLDHAEIELRVGDELGLAGNHWNGFSKVRNFRTFKDGLVPSYKIKDIVLVV